MRIALSGQFDCVALALLKLAACALVLHLGFTHVSDDDYARVVISEQFAHAPRLDPSGTSWLPFPFWVEGLAMMAAGRSLAVARGVAIALGCSSVVAPYLAMRAIDVPRGAAFIATAVASVLPWNAWLGVATVPDGWVGALVAAAAIGMGRTEARGWGAILLLAAALSRYEAWPVCAVFAAVCAANALRSVNANREVWRGLVALAGPAAWMGWNTYAHDDPLHFLVRVTAFRHAVGAADVPMASKLLGYPFALVSETPEVAVLGVVGLLGLRHRDVRARWLGAAVTAAAVMGFLVWGDLHDGAPTHHPARALGSIWWIFVGLGVDATLRAVARARITGAALAGALLLGWAVTLPWRWAEAPGRSAAEDREPQMARGKEFRERSVRHARVVPCAYEHFALLAAWGSPERATVLASTRQPVTPSCPEVTLLEE